jgi:hypothetical protein
VEFREVLPNEPQYPAANISDACASLTPDAQRRKRLRAIPAQA